MIAEIVYFSHYLEVKSHRLWVVRKLFTNKIKGSGRVEQFVERVVAKIQ